MTTRSAWLMKTIYLLTISMLVSNAYGQFYFKGLVINEKAQAIPFAKIVLHQNKLLMESGSNGEFGLSSKHKIDSASIYVEGYDTAVVLLQSGEYNTVSLEPNSETKERNLRRRKLNSLTPGAIITEQNNNNAGGESYNIIIPNRFVDAAKYPETGFSPSSNEASYTNIRRFIRQGLKVPVNAVRPEEMVNYFGLSGAPMPDSGMDFSIATRLTDCPWNSLNNLLILNVQARKLDMDEIPQANFVFLIDNSGSMEGAERLELIKGGLKKLINNLRDRDRIAIVTYGGAAGIRLPPTYGTEKEKMLKVLETIAPGGATPGSNGIRLAYELATTNAIDSANNRVILATDGDFNLGQTTEQELEDLIKGYSRSGVFLTCIGVGMGNYKDSKIETLARFGRGNFAYLDTEAEAEKVMMKELSGSMVTIAANTRIFVAFNPQVVLAYRLIGYDNNALALQDTTGMLLGGQVGSGNSLVVLVELQLSKQAFNLPLIGNLNIAYQKANDLDDDKNTFWVQQSINNNFIAFEEVSKPIKIATCITWFGEKLRLSDNLPEGNYEQLQMMATDCLSDEIAMEQELKTLIVAAAKLYETNETKKRSRKQRGKK